MEGECSAWEINSYKVLVGIPEKKSHSEDQEVDGRIILE
jgi:hypothetical protein